jgi:DNA sulfur modification protein DndD
MRIEKIILHNFRIYAGTNELVFHQKTEKNISLIAGKNGFGKTTFLTSLIWGIYGNLMTQVEEKYKRDIKTVGGYDAYLKTLINHNALNAFESGQERNVQFYVEIHLANVMIPSIPCKKLVIRRTFDCKQNEENLKILIDGQENELTREVGYDVFINDFILPREIAKFFFFDAEKIVTLAEAKSKSELRSLSKAYSEVLGIKKYEDLKLNLSTLLTKLRRAGVSAADESKIQELETKASELQRTIQHLEESKLKVELEISQCRTNADQLQEQLIREGNEMTLEDLKELNNRRDALKIDLDSCKNELKKVMDFVPLAIANNRFKELVEQINKEMKIKHATLDRDALERDYQEFQNIFKSGIGNIVKDENIVFKINTYFNELAQSRLKSNSINKGNSEILLDFDDETARRILATYDYLQNSFKSQFELIVKKEREVRQELGRVQKKLKEGEARKDNPLSIKLRDDKLELDERILNLEMKRTKIIEDLGAFRNQEASNNKVLSEMLKKSNLLKTDKKKYDVTTELLEKLNELTARIKEEKKYSLQKSIQVGLRKLMHKKDKVQDVRVRILEDVMDIDLINQSGKVIDKDTLSKGEQQLYATALLKALVDESGIDFPVFIDSPLQKFDKEHSSNVIQQFYPSISEQVVLFPLLEKELSKDEYELLKPYLSGVYLIHNSSNGSSIDESKVTDLFNKFNQQHVLAY